MNKPFRLSMILLLTCFFTVLAVTSIAAESRFEKPAFKTGKIVLTFADAPLKTMTETPFTIEIFGATGIPISDAKLSISLDMPAMPMPPNHPKAPRKDGAYRGIAVFTMAGAWQAHVTIQRPSYDQEQVTFDIERVMMK